MRHIVLPAAAAAASLLSACSSGTDEAATSTDRAAATGAATAEETRAANAVIDANTATAEQLSGIKGVSPELAAAIVSGRPYADAAAFNGRLRETIGQDEAAAVLAEVFVPVNLNTASEEAIKLIPGMTDRMAHEFLEYRPYKDMAEFDREIGKYVDAAEVARFRNYVTL